MRRLDIGSTEHARKCDRLESRFAAGSTRALSGAIRSGCDWARDKEPPVACERVERSFQTKAGQHVSFSTRKGDCFPLPKPPPTALQEIVRERFAAVAAECRGIQDRSERNRCAASKLRLASPSWTLCTVPLRDQDPPGVEWPPKPRRFKNKYTKDEQRDALIALMKLPEWKHLEEDITEWKACMRENLGEERFSEIFGAWNTDPTEEARTIRGAAASGAAYEVQRSGRDSSSPDTYRWLRERLSPKRFRSGLNALGDLSIYESSDPDVVAHRLHDAGLYAGQIENIVRRLYGLQFGRDTPNIFEVLEGRATIKDALKQQEQRALEEAARDAQRRREYFVGARQLTRFIDEHLGGGRVLKTGSINRRLDSARIRIRELQRKGGPVYQATAEGVTSGWNYIGPEMHDREAALQGLVEYAGLLARLPVDDSSATSFYRAMDDARREAAARAADPNLRAGGTG